MHLLNSRILQPLRSSRLPKIRCFIFKLETESKDVPQVEVKSRNYSLCCYRLGEKQLPLGSTDACDGNWAWMAFTSHHPWPASTLSSHLPFPLSSPPDAERRVNAAWCYLPSLPFPSVIRVETYMGCIRVESYMGSNGCTVTCPGRESLNSRRSVSGRFGGGLHFHVFLLWSSEELCCFLQSVCFLHILKQVHWLFTLPEDHILWLEPAARHAQGPEDPR